MRPKSSSFTFIWRKSIAFTVPSEISISYCSPVRLSVTDSVSCAVATPPPFSLCVSSSAMPLSSICSATKGRRANLRRAPVGGMPTARRRLVGEWKVTVPRARGGELALPAEQTRQRARREAGGRQSRRLERLLLHLRRRDRERDGTLGGARD